MSLFASIVRTVQHLARLSDEPPKKLPARSSSAARQVNASFWCDLLLSALFVVAVGATLVLVALMTIGSIRDSTESAGKVAPDMIATISRPMPDGVLCGATNYNNTSAEFSKDKVERCDGKSQTGPRLRSMLNWYGK